MEFLTKEEIQDFRKAFNLFDNDGSGTISSRELITAMQNLNLKPKEEEIQNIIKVQGMCVVNDPFGQTHSPVSSDHYSQLKIVLFFFIWKVRITVLNRSLQAVTVGRPHGWVEENKYLG